MLNREAVVKLAHERPELRAKLVPIIRKMDNLRSRQSGVLRYDGDTALDKVYAMSDLLGEVRRSLGKPLPEIAGTQKALFALERAVQAHPITKLAHGPIAFRDPDVMLYQIDPEANASKFYEMKIVQKGGETPARKVKDFSAGSATVVLQKRWGRLTDSPGTGRVDSQNEMYSNWSSAQRALEGTKQEKTRKGYKDVTLTKKYPIGLGSAGFGWGGQAACAFLPELRELQNRVADMQDVLAGFEGTVAGLQRKKSDIAQEALAYYQGLSRAVNEVQKFLQRELSECR